MIKKLIITLLVASLVSLAGCGNSAKESAEKSVALINKMDFESLWDMASEESKGKVENQLSKLKSTQMGKELIVDFLKISSIEVEKLTAKNYFILIMKKGMSQNPAKTDLVRVETSGDLAKVTTSRGGVETQSEMIKESSVWKFRIEVM